jgi:hypothetical protein
MAPLSINPSLLSWRNFQFTVQMFRQSFGSTICFRKSESLQVFIPLYLRLFLKCTGIICSVSHFKSIGKVQDLVGVALFLEVVSYLAIPSRRSHSCWFVSVVAFTCALLVFPPDTNGVSPKILSDDPLSVLSR